MADIFEFHNEHKHRPATEVMAQLILLALIVAFVAFVIRFLLRKMKQAIFSIICVGLVLLLLYSKGLKTAQSNETPQFVHHQDKEEPSPGISLLFFAAVFLFIKFVPRILSFSIGLASQMIIPALLLLLGYTLLFSNSADLSELVPNTIVNGLTFVETICSAVLNFVNSKIEVDS